MLSSTVLSYLNTCTSNLQAPLNGKQNVGDYLLTTGGTMTSNIVFSGMYGVNWNPSGGQIFCYLGDMYFHVYAKKFFFQQTGFSKVTITNTGIGIGTETPLFPLHITNYVASTQTYKYLNYSLVGGPGTYTQNYSIYCSYAICASEFNVISDEHIKKYIEKL